MKKLCKPARKVNKITLYTEYGGGALNGMLDTIDAIKELLGILFG